MKRVLWLTWGGAAIVAAGLGGGLYYHLGVLEPRRNRAGAEALFAQGNARLNSGETAAAIEDYQRAVDRDPGFVPAYNGLGMAYRSSGDLPRAEALLQEALTIDPNAAVTYYNLGAFYSQVGRYAQAVEEYGKAVQQTFAKVQLNPIEAVLLTDQGDELTSYGIPSTSPYNSFERYYRGLRGQSGNEFYRFEVRMGHVRSLNYAESQPIFKGENYSGLIAFDALDPEVRRVRLVLGEFTLKFDEFGVPLETIDCRFDFRREIEMWEEGGEDPGRSLRGPQRLPGGLGSPAGGPATAGRAAAPGPGLRDPALRHPGLPSRRGRGGGHLEAGADLVLGGDIRRFAIKRFNVGSPLVGGGVHLLIASSSRWRPA